MLFGLRICSSTFSLTHFHFLSSSFHLKLKSTRQENTYFHTNNLPRLEVVDFELYLKDQRDPDAEAPGLPVLKDAKFCNIWVGGLHEAAEKIGRTFRSADRCKGWMESLGFEGLVEEKIKVC